MKVFIDTDVVLDIVLDRDYPESKKLFKRIEIEKKIKAYTTSIVLINTYYIGTKLQDKQQARKAVQKLRLLLNVLTVTQKHIDQALASEFRDFEDAVQYYAAVSQNVDYIITRNLQDYRPSQISVLTPSQFLSLP